MSDHSAQKRINSFMKTKNEVIRKVKETNEIKMMNNEENSILAYSLIKKT